ncbi:MAG: hypothetical protein O7H41_03660 [Planctomycetota bacterium]|nr:hypothetical protein [Planctomycetota bacterium]
MRVLPCSKQLEVLQLLTEGCSIRSIERIAKVNRNTVLRYILKMGKGSEFLTDTLFRNLRPKVVEIDEIHTFVFKKQHRLSDWQRTDPDCPWGDQYTYTAIDPKSRSLLATHTGKRDMLNTMEFIGKLKRTLEDNHRVQLVSDGWEAYVYAIGSIFGGQNVDYSQVVKPFNDSVRRGDPMTMDIRRCFGKPDPRFETTTKVERQNLLMRTQIKRFTRRTNGHSKVLKYLRAAVHLHSAWYNLVRRHSSLAGFTPAYAIGVTEKVWSLEDLLWEIV